MNIPQATEFVVKLREEVWRSDRRDALIADIESGVYAPGKLPHPRISLLVALHELRASDAFMDYADSLSLVGDAPTTKTRPPPSADSDEVLAALARMPPPLDLSRIKAADDAALDSINERLEKALIPDGRFLDAVAKERLEEALRAARHADDDDQ